MATLKALLILGIAILAAGCAATRDIRVRIVDAQGRGIVGVPISTHYSGYAAAFAVRPPESVAASTDSHGEATLPVAVDWPLAATIDITLPEASVRFDRRLSQFDHHTREIEVRTDHTPIAPHKAAMVLNGPPRIEGRDASPDDALQIRNAVQRITSGTVHVVKFLGKGQAEAYVQVSATTPAQWQLYQVGRNVLDYDVVQRERVVRIVERK